MNFFRITMFALTAVFFYALTTASAQSEVGVGTTREEVVAKFGQPSGEVSSGDEQILSYPGGMIILRDNVVTDIDKDFEQRLESGRNRIKKMDKIKTEKEKSETQAIKIYKEGGRHIDLSDVIILGKITIVDFYADWCGPCRRISPYLEQLANSDTDVFLRKIDIVNWKTPLVQQYNIRSVPNIRVFDRRGNMVGSPTASFQEVQGYIKSAK
ncbi:MAG: thioredoxin family protein [Candidatus Omnitrophica bacterium]|nr:thioredoxin family protein [Candidatus Omnitrophota bacterium]MBU1925113.1 thioredoxin family protein [Candidatus Omnitrophota bacterium]